jgi:hypothetical protein
VGCVQEDALLDFGRAIQTAVMTYQATRETLSSVVEWQYALLGEAINSEDQSKLDAVVARLPSDVLLKLRAYDDCTLDPFGPKDTLPRWRAIFHRAMVTRPKPPRKSPRGQRQRFAPLEPYGFPRPPRGRPVNWPELWLTALLVEAWEAATGQSAPQVVNRGPDPTPLIAMIDAVLKLVGYHQHTPATLFESWRRNFRPLM